MTTARDELRRREAGEEARRIYELALFGLALLFTAREFERAALALAFARFLAPLLPAGAQLAGMPGQVIRTQARDGLQDFFSNRARAFAAEYGADGDAGAFRDRMTGLVTSHLIGEKTLAFGRPLLPSEILDLIEPLDFELAHLDEFADEIAIREAGAPGSARPLSVAEIGSRAELYSGSGRAVWFRADEVGQARGVVIYYLAIDDAGTCSPCLDAENGSPYLPGEGVFPGEVCRGRGRCRCIRVPKDSPAEFERLMNRKQNLTRAALL